MCGIPALLHLYGKPLIMSEIQHTGRRRGKKASPRVDLTPMVDLGFLLITFFVITTSLREPRATELVKPKDGPAIAISASETLTVFLLPNEEARVFSGHIDTAEVRSTNMIGLRHEILEKQKQILEKHGSKEKLKLIIKVLDNCSYKSVIDVLDEVLINDVRHYFFLDPTEEEKLRFKGV
jgi:biopolymer transport protein ExbD